LNADETIRSDITRPTYAASTIICSSEVDEIMLVVKHAPFRHQNTAAIGTDRVNPKSTRLSPNAAAEPITVQPNPRLCPRVDRYTVAPTAPSPQHHPINVQPTASRPSTSVIQ